MKVEPAVGRTSRLFYIDHLRTVLAALVVVHHVALVYGAAAPFYYVEPPGNDIRAFQFLLVFVLVNQSWFMGAFFLLAGYFTPGSFDRKGPGAYLRDRLLRFGVPLILFFFVLNPIASLAVYQMPVEVSGIKAPLTWRSYPSLVGMGPMWFVALLLILSLGYAGWRMLKPTRTAASAGDSSPPGYISIGVFVLVLALSSYLVRMVIPMGKAILGFPTLAYLPQYAGFFVVGIVASRHKWFRAWSGLMGVTGGVAAVLAAVLLFPLAFTGRMFSLTVSPALVNALGNGTWQSAAYALWDSTFAVGMCLALITLFRSCFNGEGGFLRLLSKQGYAVYILHVPILVWIAVALKGIEMAPLPKFLMVSAIVVPTCFVVSGVLRKLPLAAKIL